MRFTSLWTSLASFFLGWCDPAPGCSLMLRQFSDLDLLQARSYCKGFSFLLLNAPTCFHTDFTSQAQVFLAMYIRIWSSSLRLRAVCWRLLGFIQHKVLQNTVQSLFWGLQLLSPAGNKEDRMCHAASRECWKNILLDILIYCFFIPSLHFLVLSTLQAFFFFFILCTGWPWELGDVCQGDKFSSFPSHSREPRCLCGDHSSRKEWGEILVRRFEEEERLAVTKMLLLWHKQLWSLPACFIS